MGLTDKLQVRKLLEDDGLMSEIAKAVTEDPEAMDSLADDIASELSNELEDDPGLTSKIVEAAMTNPQFKSRIVRKLVDELSD